MPSSSSAACSSAAASASARAAICGAWFTIVTREPKRAKICANSRPTGPAPTTSSDSGICSSSSALMWSIQSTSSMPGTGGTAVREPAAIEDALGRQLALADAHRPRVSERRLAGDELVPGVRQHVDPALLRAAKRVLPRADAREVDLGRPAANAHPIAQLVDAVRELRRDEVRLRRTARDVRTAAAPANAFDERDPGAVVARRPRGAVACSRAGADDDEIEVFSHARIVSRRCHALRSRRGDDAERGAARRGAPAR